MTEDKEKKFIDYRANDFQLKVMKSKKKMIFAGCGVGSGKTDVGSLWILRKVKQMVPGQIGLISANSYTQLKDSTIRNLYKNCRNWSVPILPEKLPSGHSPSNIYIWNGKCYCEILCRSMGHYEDLSGMEIAWAWCDEVWGTIKDAIDLVLARMRDDRGSPIQILLTTNLDDPGSWMHEMFVDNFTEKLMDVVYASSYANEKNLPEGYIEGLKTLYTAKKFQRMVLAKWVSLEGSVLYHNFDRSVHRDVKAEMDPCLPIIWSHDFNIGQGKPMSSILGQIKKGKDKKGTVRPELHIFSEIVLDSSDTQHAVDEFNNRYEIDPKDREQVVTIYGDASGRAKDTRSRTTDYEILRQAGFTNQKVPKANPPLRSRHNAVNLLLKNAAGDVRLFCHPRCKNLIKGMETTILKGGAQYLEKEAYEQHATTSLGYLVCQEFPLVRLESGMLSVTGF